MQVSQNKVVTIHYTLTNDEGQKMDSSRKGQPLPYIHGIGNLIPGLEKELEGKSAGAKLLAVIEPKDAYGEWESSKEHLVPLAGFQGQGDEKLATGMRVQVDMGEQKAVAMVTKIEGDQVTLDLNHPLAGQTLHFDVEIMDVRDAEQVELDHGHVHGPGGHEH